MPYDPEIHVGRLRRLDPSSYRGTAWVHWVMTMEGRRSGWLTDGFHGVLREALLHFLGRYELICPVYCLMSDHVLTEDERQEDALQGVCFYIRENPVRAGLVADSSQWPYWGALAAGYPDLDPREDGFWERFWGIYVRVLR